MAYRHEFRAIAIVLASASLAVADAPARLADFGRWVIAADYARDGTTLVTAGGDSLLYRPGDVVAWNVADGTRIGEFVGHPTAVWAVRLSPDGRLLATAGYDGLVRLWDVSTRQPKHDLKKHKGWVRGVAFSPDGTRLASAGEDGSVVLWDIATGAEVKTIAAHEGAAACVAYAPDGQTLASGGGDNLVKLWNAADGSERARLEGHGDLVWAVAYAADGGTLASGGADRTIRLWNPGDGKPKATLAGHTDWVTSLAFSGDGSRLVSGGIDGTVKLWDPSAAGEQEGPAKAESSVWTVAFAPVGTTLFVGTHAGPRLTAAPAPKLLPPPPQPATPSPAAPPTPAAAATLPLVPREFASMAGAAATVATDGTVTITGSLAKDTYTLKAVVPGDRQVAAIRLEVLADDTLPQKGPGRAGNGNFVLSTFAVLAGPPGGGPATAVRFASAQADFEQPKYGVAAAIDDAAETGWAIAGGIGRSHEATFVVHPDTPLAAGAPVTITLDQQYTDGQHALGKFRLSVVPTPAAP
ncbi:MAG: WD40 repeat domain-containing protein [Planctomycetaceae bacterium]